MAHISGHNVSGESHGREPTPGADPGRAGPDSPRARCRSGGSGRYRIGIWDAHTNDPPHRIGVAGHIAVRGQARATLPALRQEVHTFSRRREPPFTLVRTVWMFGFQRRWVRRRECDTDMPKPGPLPQTSQTAATSITPQVDRIAPSVGARPGRDTGRASVQGNHPPGGDQTGATKTRLATLGPRCTRR